jgi:flagellar biosynthesis protein FliP
VTRRTVVLVALVLGALVLGEVAADAQAPPQRLDLKVEGVGTVSAPLQIVLLLTLLSFVPAILVTMTSFTRIVIVFHFLRQALGTQEQPSNQILIGLTLFLTMFIMAPVADRMYESAMQPAMAGRIDMSEALERGTPPMREFMLKQTREADLALFVELARLPARTRPTTCRCASSFRPTSSRS